MTRLAGRLHFVASWGVIAQLSFNKQEPKRDRPSTKPVCLQTYDGVIPFSRFRSEDDFPGSFWIHGHRNLASLQSGLYRTIVLTWNDENTTQILKALAEQIAKTVRTFQNFKSSYRIGDDGLPPEYDQFGYSDSKKHQTSARILKKIVISAYADSGSFDQLFDLLRNAAGLGSDEEANQVGDLTKSICVRLNLSDRTEKLLRRVSEAEFQSVKNINHVYLLWLDLRLIDPVTMERSHLEQLAPDALRDALTQGTLPMASDQTSGTNKTGPPAQKKRYRRH